MRSSNLLMAFPTADDEIPSRCPAPVKLRASAACKNAFSDPNRSIIGSLAHYNKFRLLPAYMTSKPPSRLFAGKVTLLLTGAV